MAAQTDGMPASELGRIIESARALGVEIDEELAIQWLTAISADHDGALAVDEHSGVFAHRVVMLDFDPRDLDRLRRVAAIVELEDAPDVETAIALSGSSAQSLVQTFPGDFDYFERVNIRAESREAACRRLAEVLREKALAAARGPGYQLIEVRFGSAPQEAVRGGDTLKAGASLCWTPAEVEAGRIEALTPGGETLTIRWEDAAADPGWCKLDWVLVDPAQPRAVKASNMLDVTWESPAGEIVPLDGFIDPYYQEVYLDAASVPLFSKIQQHLEPEALYWYVEQLEKEIRKYTHGPDANFGKAAKRMYNVFRLTGRYEAAAYVRELFDEPAALLYQVSALLDGLLDLGRGTQTIDQATLTAQMDGLIRAVSNTIQGGEETELIMALLRVRDDVTGVSDLGGEWGSTLIAIQSEINRIVNRMFEKRLRSIPQVASYLDMLG